MALQKIPTQSLVNNIQLNCDISDARDHGIYSICILVLKLRNLYKWEKGLEPWDEPESSEVLEWIARRENYWETIVDQEYHPLEFNGARFDPFDVHGVNASLSHDKFYYGAGYGRSMKPVFFLAEILKKQNINGNNVLILGSEKARELAGPFALKQEDNIIIRKEQLRFFLWDHLQEIRPSAKDVMLHVLHKFKIIKKKCEISRESIQQNLAAIVEQEIPVFIRHEIGETQDTPLGGEILQKIIHDFPDSLIEFFSRAVKDVLADTHPEGMLRFIIQEKREMSLAFFVSFLTGIRRTLFPEISKAVERFIVNGEGGWDGIEAARAAGWENNLKRAELIAAIVRELKEPDRIAYRMEKELLEPLGLGK